MKELPKKTINSTNFVKKNHDEMDEFELLPIKIEKILVQSSEGALVVFTSGGKQVGYPLNAIEGTMLVFVQSQCTKLAHIPTIYHLFLSTYRDLGWTLETTTLEAKLGDVFYGRIKWKNAKGKNIYSQCSGGDAIVLAQMTEAKINVVKKVLDDMDEFNLEFDMYE